MEIGSGSTRLVVHTQLASVVIDDCARCTNELRAAVAEIDRLESELAECDDKRQPVSASAAGTRIYAPRPIGEAAAQSPQMNGAAPREVFARPVVTNLGTLLDMLV